MTTAQMEKFWFDGQQMMVQRIPEESIYKREWGGLMRGVRVEGDTVVISVKGGNDVARHLCAELLKEKNT